MTAAIANNALTSGDFNSRVASGLEASAKSPQPIMADAAQKMRMPQNNFDIFLVSFVPGKNRLSAVGRPNWSKGTRIARERLICDQEP